MCTSRSLVSRICFYTTRAGAYANELEVLSRYAGARRSGRPAQLLRFAPADFPAAADVRLHLRAGDGAQWIYAGGVQELIVARHYGDQHGIYRSLGGCHAIDCGVSVHA